MHLGDNKCHNDSIFRSGTFVLSFLIGHFVRLEVVKMVSIRSIAVKEKVCEFDMPGFEPFKVTLAYISKEKLRELLEACSVKKWNRSAKASEESLDTKKFQSMYAETVVKGWKGLTFGLLQKLMLIEIPEGASEEDEVPFSLENAEDLLKASNDFDNFVSSCLADLENFTKKN